MQGSNEMMTTEKLKGVNTEKSSKEQSFGQNM